MKIVAALCVCMLAGCSSSQSKKPSEEVKAVPAEPAPAEFGSVMGNFSVSLAVKDIAASQNFYEKLGFRQVGGNITQRWVVMQNDTAVIGLFQGMFDKNILTFNPGWDRNKKPLANFRDVREIQRDLRQKGIEPKVAADEKTDGPASLVIVDPDGNQILFDQFVPAPKKATAPSTAKK